MSTVLSSRAQQILEGVDLPADRASLLAYAVQAGAPPDVLLALQGLPRRRMGSLDEVGEAIHPVQPPAAGRRPDPEPHSGVPPGGPDYLEPSPTPGAAREELPGAEGS